MKTTIAAVLFLGLLVVNLQGAGSENIIKQRAKDLRDQNNARQGVAPATPPKPTTSQPAVSGVPNPGAQTIGRFQAEFSGIKSGVAVSAEQKDKLAKLIVASAQGSSKPSAVAAEKLAIEISAGLAANPMSATGRARLAQNLDGLLNPARYPQARKQAIVDDIQTIFQAGGMVRSRAQVLGQAAKAVADEVDKSR